MAGSSVVATQSGTGPIKKVSIAWTSDSASGGASGTLTFSSNGARIIRLTTDPGTAAPTDNYDIVLDDSDLVDALQSLGADRDTANTEDTHIVYSGTSLHPVAMGTMTFKVSAAGNSKNGTAIIYYEGA